MRPIIISALLGITALSQPARATGICENNPRHYDPPVRYSQTEKRLAFEGSQEYCDEVEEPSNVPDVHGSPKEDRGTVHFIEIRDMKNTVVERLSSARGALLNRIEGAVGPMTTVPPGRMDATLKARGFVPIAATAKSPAGACSIRTSWKRDDTQNGFPAGTLKAEVVSGKKVIMVADLGMVAEARYSEVALRGLFLPEERALLLWARVPQCIGGPPPGYWGKDSPGTCYPGDEIATQLLSVTATANAQLAICFKPSPAP